MPQFTAMKPNEVLIGRARVAAEERKPFVEHLKTADAGRIELQRGENSGRMKRLLSDAAKEAGVRIRSSWEDRSKRVLLWKRVGK